MESPTTRSTPVRSSSSAETADDEEPAHIALKPYPHVQPAEPTHSPVCSPLATTTPSAAPVVRSATVRDPPLLPPQQPQHSGEESPVANDASLLKLSSPSGPPDSASSFETSPFLPAGSPAATETPHSRLMPMDEESTRNPDAEEGLNKETPAKSTAATPTGHTSIIPTFQEESDHRDPAHHQGEDDVSDSDTALSDLDIDSDEMLSDDEEIADDEETGLTNQQKQKRRRRRRRLMRLGDRVAHNSDGAADNDAEDEEEIRAEEKLANAYIFKDIFVNVCLVGAWYTFSISISVYNKWMFSSDNLNFHFPLFTTSIHMLVQFSLASLVLWLVPRFRPKRPSAPSSGGEYAPITSNGDQPDAASHFDSSNPPRKPSPSEPLMTYWFYLSRIGPCGAATAMDIGLGNFSLRFISLTFFTMCKSSVLGFVLIFAFLFHLEKPTWKLCAVIVFMTLGVVMMVAGEAAFNALGFILVMSASLCSGFRWSLTQILLLRNPATSNPFSSIFFLTPVMFLALIILAVPIEGISHVLAGFNTLIQTHNLAVAISFMLFPGVLAFLMVAAEFALLKRTSVVTLSVCGIFKEVLTISAASLTFGDELSPINVSGLFITIAAIAAYNYLKYATLRRNAHREAMHVLDSTAPRRPSLASVRSSTGSFHRGADPISSSPLPPSASTNIPPRYSISSNTSSASASSARHPRPPTATRQPSLFRLAANLQRAASPADKPPKLGNLAKNQ